MEMLPGQPKSVPSSHGVLHAPIQRGRRIPYLVTEEKGRRIDIFDIAQ